MLIHSIKLVHFFSFTNKIYLLTGHGAFLLFDVCCAPLKFGQVDWLGGCRKPNEFIQNPCKEKTAESPNRVADGSSR